MKSSLSKQVQKGHGGISILRMIHGWVSLEGFSYFECIPKKCKFLNDAPLNHTSHEWGLKDEIVNIFLRIPAMYEVKNSKIYNFWTFWPVIQLINHLFQ